MISRADAEAAARDHLGPDGEIGLAEFDAGYIVWIAVPPPADPTAVPPCTSRPTAVIDKATGELTAWPSLPVPIIAARYTAHRAATGRFPADVRAAIERAGWWPGRNTEAAVLAWLNEPSVLAAVDGIAFSEPARAALIEFGGLRLPQAGPGGAPDGGFPSRFFPIPEPVATDGVRAFTRRTGIPATPIGDHADGPGDLVMDPDGRVFLLHWSDDFVVGTTLEAALVWLVRGGELTPL